MKRLVDVSDAARCRPVRNTSRNESVWEEVSLSKDCWHVFSGAGGGRGGRGGRARLGCVFRCVYYTTGLGSLRFNICSAGKNISLMLIIPAHILQGCSYMSYTLKPNELLTCLHCCHLLLRGCQWNILVLFVYLFLFVCFYTLKWQHHKKTHLYLC